MAGFGFFGGGWGNIFRGWEAKKSSEVKAEEKLINKETLIAVDANGEDPSILIDSNNTSEMLYGQGATEISNVAKINTYRMMAAHHDVDNAIEDICNAVVSCDEDELPVSIDLTNVEMSESIKEKILDEFEVIVNLLSFNETAYEKLKQWYVDGRQAYQIIIDENARKKGIIKLVMLDPRAIRKVKEIDRRPDKDGVETIRAVEDYYVYDTSFMYAQNISMDGSTQNAGRNSFSMNGQRIKLRPDSVAFIHSGLVADGGIVLSYLDKAQRPLNLLQMVEDSIVIYRYTRASEKRAFFIETGEMPGQQALSFVNDVMQKYRTKIEFNSQTGMVSNRNHQVSMLEDYWLPSSNGKGTRIETVDGGQNLGNLDDLYYLQKNLYSALNVPRGRIDGEGSGAILLGGRGAEITRDENKFSKFVARLRRRYSGLFLNLLRTQLALKGIASYDEFDEFIKPKVRFVFASDSYMKEQQELEKLQSQINMLGEVQPYIGTYFSRDTVNKVILQRTEEEIRTEDDQIKQEIKDGIIPDPNQEDDDADGFDPEPLQSNQPSKPKVDSNPID